MEYNVRYCSTDDGVRIAYSAVGEGPALVLSPMWISPFILLDYDQEYERFCRRLGERRQLILIDQRGTGASDRDVADFSREALARDIAAVADDLGVARLSLFAIDFGCRPALEFAAHYPERVTRIVLYAPYVNAGGHGTAEARSALVDLVRGGWQLASRFIPVMIMPGAPAESQKHFFTALSESCSADAAAAWLAACFADDLSSVASQVQAETLVIHAREDAASPYESGRQLASLLPNGRLTPIKRGIHAPHVGDASEILGPATQFLPARRVRASSMSKRPSTSGLLTILFTDIVSSTALTQRLGDARAQELVRAHNAIVRDALTAHSGSEVKHTGDGIMASFGSTADALQCAVAIQRAVGERADPDLQVHIGLNAGEPVAEERDLFGTAVQLARRICDQAAAGEVLVSDVVRQLAAGKGFVFAERGDTPLKGFDKPVRLFDVRRQD